MFRRFNKGPKVAEFDAFAFAIFAFTLWAAGFCMAASIFGR